MLAEITQAIVDESFLDSLFLPQQACSFEALTKIFERLAHTSVMRLSSNSMSKLIDLMVMGLKHQVVMLQLPSDLALVTENHLLSLRDMVEATPLAASRVSAALERFQARYDALTWGDWEQLRASLLQSLKDRRIKVSLFLQQKIQASDGKFVLSPRTGPLPPGVRVPGTVEYFSLDTGALTLAEHFAAWAPGCAACEQAAEERVISLGLSLYTASPTRRKRRARVRDARLDRLSATTKLSAEQLKRRERMQVERMVRQELSSLAGLIRAPAERDDGAAFDLNLFPSLAASTAGSASAAARTTSAPVRQARLSLSSNDSDNGDAAEIIEFDTGDATAHLGDVRRDLDAVLSGAPDEAPDDLLALMDAQ